jgi:hypothetical protein
MATGDCLPTRSAAAFGRIPERTQYLPDEGRALDPPLREAWSVDPNALIEYPPAVANGVAYVVNKYGDVRFPLWPRFTPCVMFAQETAVQWTRASRVRGGAVKANVASLRRSAIRNRPLGEGAGAAEWRHHAGAN